MTKNNKIMTLRNAKTILFAGIIGMMILPFSTIDFADAQNVPGEEDFTDEIGPVGKVNEIHPRSWANTTEMIENHENYVRFMTHEMQDNFFNNEQKEASIIAYNIETEIGKDVNAYELVSLNAKLQIINDTYNPTESERKLHEWIFVLYDLPEKKSEIKQRIVFITNNADSKTVNELISAINRLINIGAVTYEISDMDPDYWFGLGAKATCEHDPNCDMSILQGFNEWEEPQLVPVTNYGFHWGYISVDYRSCQGDMDQCRKSHHQSGTGIISENFNSPEHVIETWA